MIGHYTIDINSFFEVSWRIHTPNLIQPEPETVRMTLPPWLLFVLRIWFTASLWVSLKVWKCTSKVKHAEIESFQRLHQFDGFEMIFSRRPAD